MNYDPNIRHAVQRVRLYYAWHNYRGQAEVVVTGDYRGLEVLEWALGLHYEQLAIATGELPAQLQLQDALGDVEVVEDNMLMATDWLQDMLVGAQILSIEPGPAPARAPA